MAGPNSQNQLSLVGNVKKCQLGNKLDLRCPDNVKCCGNLCPASPTKVLREQYFGFVSSLSISNHMMKRYSSTLKKTTKFIWHIWYHFSTGIPSPESRMINSAEITNRNEETIDGSTFRPVGKCHIFASVNLSIFFCGAFQNAMSYSSIRPEVHTFRKNCTG